jgi:rieske iron-sulfur protein
MADSPRVPNLLSTDCQRRAVLRGAAGLVIAWLTPIGALAAQASESGPPPVPGDLLVRADDPNFIPLAPDDIPFDSRGLFAWAIGPADSTPKNAKLNRVLLARLNPATMGDATRQRAADDIVAYSAVCTHAGCEVDEGLGGAESIFCSCHGSSFDARNGGMNIGGPANRRLAALPLKIDGGRLVVAGSFTEPPGYGPG